MSLKLSKEQEETLQRFIDVSLPEIVEQAGHDELYGHQLTASGTYYSESITKTLLAKYLKANDFKLEESVAQLTKSLEWRKEFNPLKAAFLEKHAPKLIELGYVTKVGKIIYTWNIYGKIQANGLLKDDGQFDEFVRYRIGLMERGLQLITFKGEDCNLGQIHDYENVSLIRYDADTKKASKKIIQLFQDYYPELLSKKYFVNVPKLMAWIYDLVKGWLPSETTKKFKMITNGSKLAKAMDNGEDIPVKYGGKSEKSLDQQNIDDVKMTEYTTFLLEEQFTNELD